MRIQSLIVFLALSTAVFGQADLQSPPEVVFETFITGLQNPVRMVQSPDGRLFILEKDQGNVEVYNADGSYIGTFLNVSGLISTGSERGLLGIAFHPDYPTTDAFYLNYTDGNGDTVISEWNASAGDPNFADASSESILLTIPQDFSNHNGGHIAFGPDGFLYIGMGDGGSGGDPNNRAQDGQSLLGKILRIRVTGSGIYNVPVSNPFVGNALYLDEIWAIGVRNPWAFSWDSANGDLWIGDVGQDSQEEISYVDASSAGGENYGWRCWEGDNTFNTSDCSSIPHTPPVQTHDHTGFSGWCSITGGAVYRGAEFPGMQGYYIYTDYCLGEIHALKDDGIGGFDHFTVNGNGYFGYVDFCETQGGDLYLVDIGGSVLKVKDNCNTLPTISVSGESLEASLAGADDYAWYLDGSLVASGTSQTFDPTQGGEYAVLVDQGGCVRLSNVLNIAVAIGEPGCTYPDALNYSPTAMVDDGTCTFDCPDAGCPSDINGNGFTDTGDLLVLLANFGSSCI